VTSLKVKKTAERELELKRKKEKEAKRKNETLNSEDLADATLNTDFKNISV